MNVSWFEQTAADVPARDDWLSLAEQALLSRLLIPKRRSDWRLGRWTAKRALAAYLGIRDIPHAMAEIEIRSAPSGMPEAFFADAECHPAISISHRANVAACAVSSSSSALGCDLELIEPRNQSFLEDYFTPEEQAMVELAAAQDRAWLLTLLWSAKESALKALGEGLRLDTRSVTALPVIPLRRTVPVNGGCAVNHSLNGSGRWSPLRVRNGSDRVFHGWWMQEGMLVRTLVADPPPLPPQGLSSLIDPIPEASLNLRAA